MKQAGLATTLETLPQWPDPAMSDPDKTLRLLRELASSASKQWTATFNPRPTSESDMLSMYQSALKRG